MKIPWNILEKNTQKHVLREVHEAYLSDNKKLVKLGGQEEERTLQANVGRMCRCGREVGGGGGEKVRQG